MKKILLLAAILFGCMLYGCIAGPSGSAKQQVQPDPAFEQSSGGGELVIYSTHPYAVVSPLIEAFKQQTGISVELISAGSGELLRCIEKEYGSPLGDVLWGGSLGVTAGKTVLFESYTSVNEPELLAAFQNTEGCLTRFTDLPNVLLINTERIGDLEINGYADLLDPALKGRIAYCNPAKASSGFEHLVNMLYAMGAGSPEDGWAYVEQFCENLDGRLLASSSAVCKGVLSGEYAVGLTYEESAARYLQEGRPVQIVYMEEGVIARPDGVYIIKGAKNQKSAQAFIDFLTSRPAQQMAASELYRRPVRADVEPSGVLPDKSEFTLLDDDVQYASSQREAWLERFQQLYNQNV